MMQMSPGEWATIKSYVNREATIDVPGGDPVNGRVQTIKDVQLAMGRLSRRQLEAMGRASEVILPGILHLRKPLAHGNIVDLTVYDQSWFIQGTLNVRNMGTDIVQSFEKFHRQICLVGGYLYKSEEASKHVTLEVLGVKPLEPQGKVMHAGLTNIEWFRGVWDEGIRAKMSGNDSGYSLVEQEFMVQIRRLLLDAGYIDTHGCYMGTSQQKGYAGKSVGSSNAEE